MTHRLRLVGMCLLIAGVVRPALAQPAPAPAPTVSSAPWLGPEKYNVHLAGSLKSVLEGLGKLTSRNIMLPMQNGVGNGDAGKGDVMVKVDMDDATLDQILLSLCQQAGVVYDANPNSGFPGQGGFLPLRVGDPRLDARPVVSVGDYVVRIGSISRQTTLTKNLRWGQAVPEQPEVNANMSLSVEVTAKTLDAARKLAGINPHYQAFPDQGAPLEAGGTFPPTYYSPFWPGPNASFQTARTSINLKVPPPEATKLTRLEGTLVLYSTVKITEMKITPNSLGQTFQQEDVTMTEKSWNVQGQQLSVGLEGKCAPLPRKAAPFGGAFRDTQTAVLVAKDGRELPSQGGPFMGGSNSSEGTLKLNFSFTAPQTAWHAPGAGGPVETEGPFVIDYVRITFVRPGDADGTLPFVITDIPLH